MNLPFPVFITKVDGTFLEMNDAARSLFFPDGISDRWNLESIINFYKYKEDRDYVLSSLRKVLHLNTINNKREWETKKVLEFEINGRKQNLRLYGKPYGDENGNLQGCLSIAFPVPEIDKFHLFENEISNGVFELGWRLELIYSNQRFRELLKLDSKKESIYFSDLFPTMEDFESVMAELKKDPHKEIYKFNPIILKTRDNNQLLGNLVIQPQYSDKGDIIKARAIFRDLTNHEIVENAPIGIYLVMRINNEDVIVKANKQFLDIQEFDSEKDCIGFPVKKLHLNPESLLAFEEKLEAASKNQQMLENYEFKIKTFKGNIKTLRVNAKMIFDRRTNKKIGRIGIVFDVNNAIDEVRKELQQDFEDFFHSYYHHLLNIQGGLISVVNGHGASAVTEGNIDIDLSMKLMNENILKLSADWESLEKEIQQKGIEFDSSKVRGLISDIVKNREVESYQYEERANWVRLIVIDIRRFVQTLQKDQPIHRETLKLITNDFIEILRYARLISLAVIIKDIIPFLDDIDKFKIDVFSEKESRVSKVDVLKIINEVQTSLAEFAQERNVFIRTRYYSHNIFIDVDEREFYKAFYNILHNAIKYSRNETKVNRGYVNLVISEGFDHITIETDNLGVPIRRDELERKLIFNFRFRGASAIEDREGHGIGLWSVKKFIDKYGGSIAISSTNTGYNRIDDYSKWFKTTVTIKIKKSKL